MGSSPEPVFHRNGTHALPKKGRIPRRRGLRSHRVEWGVFDASTLDDQPMFSHGELTGSGFDALLAELDGSLTLDLTDE